MILHFSQIVFSQDYDSIKKGYYVESSFHYGFILEQLPRYKGMLKRHTKSFELNWGVKADGRYMWQQYYHYPKIGLGFHYADFGSQKILGEAYSFFPYIKIPLGATDKNEALLFFKFSFGAAYLTQHFDSEKNYYNIAIGSSLNVYANLSFDSRICITDNLLLNLGFGMTHYSNGTFETPNLGLNLINFRAGLKYQFNNDDYKRKYNIPEKIKGKQEFYLWGTVGAKEDYPPDGEKFFSSALVFDYGKYRNTRRKTGIGLDLFYEKTLLYLLEKDGKSNIKPYFAFRSGIHYLLEYKFGKINFYGNIGTYFYTKRPNKREIIYERIGLLYKFSKHFYTHISLKVHYVRADYIGIGLGYYF